MRRQRILSVLVLLVAVFGLQSAGLATEYLVGAGAGYYHESRVYLVTLGGVPYGPFGEGVGLPHWGVTQWGSPSQLPHSWTCNGSCADRKWLSRDAYKTLIFTYSPATAVLVQLSANYSSQGTSGCGEADFFLGTIPPSFFNRPPGVIPWNARRTLNAITSLTVQWYHAVRRIATPGGLCNAPIPNFGSTLVGLEFLHVSGSPRLQYQIISYDSRPNFHAHGTGAAWWDKNARDGFFGLNDDVDRPNDSLAGCTNPNEDNDTGYGWPRPVANSPTGVRYSLDVLKRVRCLIKRAPTEGVVFPTPPPGQPTNYYTNPANYKFYGFYSGQYGNGRFTLNVETGRFSVRDNIP